ncbi:MAG: SAM-dependent methyltransferase [Propionibacteriaceae bacterium]|jgi:23S rRNA (guanine745-N1)-methyltransferase|nr:SAM-dependent methyltransferase [Propionibacteriaceae bacterium]
MALTAAAGVVTCPVCRNQLGLLDATGAPLASAADGVASSARCVNGHNFDVARSGYLNLSGKATPQNADTASMVQARARFLGSHAYDVVVEHVLTRVVGDLVVEAGAGPAYYLAHCVEAAPERRGIAIDVSPAAARVAARAHPRIASLVADIWDGLPLADGCVTTLLDLFAPRNLPEFARVLAPGGALVVVVPNPGHLAGLRRRFDLLRIHPDKVDDLIDRVPSELVLQETSQIGLSFQGSAEHVRDLIEMGPNAFHERKVKDAPEMIDIDLSLLVWRKQG